VKPASTRKIGRRHAKRLKGKIVKRRITVSNGFEEMRDGIAEQEKNIEERFIINFPNSREHGP
jgi:hypothetical protein